MSVTSRPDNSSLLDRTCQIGYVVTYRCWQIFLRFSKIGTTGAQVLVTFDDQVLLIKTSYRPTYSLPGGYLGKLEDYASAACREVMEETGIVLDRSQLNEMLLFEQTHSGRLTSNMIFTCNINPKPLLTMDKREVVFARFVPIQEALSMQLDEIARTSICHFDISHRRD